MPLLLGSALAILVGMFARPLILRHGNFQMLSSFTCDSIRICSGECVVCNQRFGKRTSSFRSRYTSFCPSVRCVSRTFRTFQSQHQHRYSSILPCGKSLFQTKILCGTIRSTKSMTRIMSQKYRYPYSTHSAFFNSCSICVFCFFSTTSDHRRWRSVFRGKSNADWSRFRRISAMANSCYLHILPMSHLAASQSGSYSKRQDSASKSHSCCVIRYHDSYFVCTCSARSASPVRIYSSVKSVLDFNTKKQIARSTPEHLLLLDRIETFFGRGLYLPLLRGQLLDCRLATAGNDGIYLIMYWSKNEEFVQWPSRKTRRNKKISGDSTNVN